MLVCINVSVHAHDHSDRDVLVSFCAPKWTGAILLAENSEALHVCECLNET